MANPFSYQHKRVVVTGGSSGLGAALVRLLADLGAASITVLDRQEPVEPIRRRRKHDEGSTGNDGSRLDQAVIGHADADWSLASPSCPF